MKIARGIIYHTLIQSFFYFIRSLVFPLKVDNKIYELETSFARYCKRKYCVVFPFARTGIYFVLKNLNLPKGSKILMPPITIKGILDVVINLELIPQYVELDKSTMCFDMADLINKICFDTKAVIITPLFGLVPDMEAMCNIFRQNNIYIIEDFSQCLNGSYKEKRIGTFGDVGVYSASSIKTLDSLGGGFVIMDDKNLKESLVKSQHLLDPPRRWFLIKKAFINFIRNLATTQPYFSISTYPILQFTRILNPNASLKQTGNRNKLQLKKLPDLWFSKYTSVQALIALKLLKTVKSDDRKRISYVETLKSQTKNDLFPNTTLQSRNVYWQLIILTSDAIKTQLFFANRGIDIATSSLELISDLQDYPHNTPLPVAKNIYCNGVLIPCYPYLSHKHLKRIAKCLNDFFL